MYKHRTFKKSIIWALIAAMANPAAMLPAFARDTDIFLDTTPNASSAQPNILLILDTSDSMNIPQGWKELTAAEAASYDSHYEYLWSDPTFISTIGCPLGAACQAGDTDSDPAKNLSTPTNDNDVLWSNMSQGFFAGSDAAARAALKHAALVSAQATYPGDPGARTLYRNYGGGVNSTPPNMISDISYYAPLATQSALWVYWLPAGTPESDMRLTSDSPSRAPLGSEVSFFSSGNGPANPVVRGGTNYGNILDWNYNNFDFPSYSYKQSQGANQCVSSYTKMLPSTVYAPGPYPKNEGKWLGHQWTRYERFLGLDNSHVVNFPAGNAAGDAAETQWVQPPWYNGYWGANHLGRAPATTPMVDDYLQAIRVQGGGSYSGWTDIRSDLGGWNYLYWLYYHPESDPVLVNTLTAFGISSTPLQARVRASVRTFEPGAHVSSLPGCTNAATCANAGVSLGIPAYVDYLHTIADQTAYVAPAPTTCAWSPSDGRLGAGPDAYGGYNQYRSGAPGTATNPSCVLVSGPGSCYVSPNKMWYPARYLNAHWEGRQQINTEAQTFFYGGTCVGQCSYGTGNAAYCPIGAAANPGVPGAFVPAPTYSYTDAEPSRVANNTTIYNVRTDNAAAGCYDLPSPPPIACSVNTPGCVDNTYDIYCSAADPAPGALPNIDVYDLAAIDYSLYHDCLDDNGTAGNPSNAYPTGQQLPFNTYYVASTSGGSYTNAAAQAYPADDAKKVDMYAVNYLNYKFGPRGPNGFPIARKTRLQIAKDALANLIQTTNGVRLGLEVFNSLPANASDRDTLGSQGGHIVYPISKMGSGPADPDFANRDVLITRLNAQEAKAATPLTESLYEAYRYFSGRTPMWGTAGDAALGGGTISQGYNPSALCTASNGQDCFAAGAYRSPMMNNPTVDNPAGCQKNYIVMITDGGPDRDFSGNADIKTLKYSQTVTTAVATDTQVDTNGPATTTHQLEPAVANVPTGTPYGPQDPSGASYDNGYVWLDELAYFMGKADVSPGARNLPADAGTDHLAKKQSVVTYTIGFAGGDSPVLTNAATASGGAYFNASNSSELADALTAAITAIKTFNPTIAAPTVPISATNRAESQNEVYLTFFQPDPSQAWLGTVKKYQIGLTDADCGVGLAPCTIGQTELEAATGKNIAKVDIDNSTDPPTINTVINPNAYSFWSSLVAPASPDGGSPVKGGTGAQLLFDPATFNPSTRKIYTHLTASTSPVLTNAVNAMNITNSAINKCVLGDTAACSSTATMSDATRVQLINFLRGGDPGNSACNGTSAPAADCLTWRAWPHADVQHSQPAIVGYDASLTSPVQYLFYVSNSGLLEAVDSSTGREQWAFAVEEALPRISDELADSPGPSLDIADGSPVIYRKDVNHNGKIEPADGDKVWLFFGLRRGGRAIYALDITNPNAPVFKWKISNATVGFTELGQSWSKPVVGLIRNLGSTAPALIFGGGYDPNQDNSPVTLPDVMGRAVFVVNGDTGALIKGFDNGNVTGGMTFSIPSDVAAYNTDADQQNFLDRVYVGDTGGNLYRFDINDPNAANWKGKKLAHLSDTPDSTFGGKRKILFPPSVVKYSPPYAPERFDGVFVGTGDREDPRLATSNDVMAMVMDRDFGLNMGNGAAFEYPTDFLNLDNTNVTGVTSADLVTKDGWARTLEVGEKVVGSPSVLFGILRFPSYAPNVSNVCSPVGEGRVNTLNALLGFVLSASALASAASSFNANTPPVNPLATSVTFDERYNHDQTIASYPTTTGYFVDPSGNVFLMTCPTCFKQVGKLGVVNKTYWYLQTEQ